MTITPGDFSESSIMNPAANAVAITPANVDLDKRSRALYIGTTGDLTVLMAGGQSVEFVGVVAGSLLPIRVVQVNTATTAADIVSIY